MNKKIVIVFVMMVLIMALGVILFLNRNATKELELTYKSNGGVPYKWEYEIVDDSIITFVKSYQKANKNNGKIVGAPIYTNYVFKGLKEGETAIIFKYVSITDGSVWKQEVNKIKVDNDNRISLISTEKRENLEYSIDEAMEELHKYFNNEEGINFNYLETVEGSDGSKYYKFDVRKHNEIVNSRLDIYYIGVSKEKLVIYDSELFKKRLVNE